MFENYTASAFLCVLTLLVMVVQVYENNRFSARMKRGAYRTIIVLILCILAEWGAIALNGAPGWTYGLHVAVKFANYLLMPVTGFLFVEQIADKRWHRPVTVSVLSVNTVLQVVSVFTGAVFYVDEANYYHHGPYYFLYALLYTVTIAYLFTSIGRYGRRFRKSNRASHYTIMLVMVVGVVLQEIVSSQLRTVSIALTFGLLLLFIHNSEFAQQDADDTIKHTHDLLCHDALTGLLSRYAYNEALNEYPGGASLPGDLVVFSLDLNSLKNVNDSLGHEAGDELICGMAECITQAMGRGGRCFRIGGDEFVCLLSVPADAIDSILERLNAAVTAWHGDKVKRLDFAIGHACACDFPGLSIEKLVNEADKMMYADKEDYRRRMQADAAGLC